MWILLSLGLFYFFKCSFGSIAYIIFSGYVCNSLRADAGCTCFSPFPISECDGKNKTVSFLNPFTIHQFKCTFSIVQLHVNIYSISALPLTSLNVQFVILERWIFLIIVFPFTTLTISLFKLSGVKRLGSCSNADVTPLPLHLILQTPLKAIKR